MDSDDDLTADLQGPPGKKGLMGYVLGAALLGGVATTAYVLEAPSKVAAMLGKGDQTEGEKPAKQEDVAIIDLENFVVSLAEEGQIKRSLPRLNVAVAIMTTNPDEVLEAKPQLRNDFIAVIRVIEPSTLRAPEGLEYLRGQLAGQAEAILGEDFKGVLITEFILL